MRNSEEPPELIDTHAHLDFPEFVDDIPGTLARAQAAGVGTIITIGISIETSRKAAQIAEAHGRIFAAAGIHPHDSFMLDEPSLGELEQILRGERVVAVGEIGLDYYRDYQPRPVQKECMRRQIELACRIGKPVVFHVREAWADFFDIIYEYAPSLSGSVMHCFSGDREIAKKCLDLGLYLSIPGVVTYHKADELQKVVELAPLDRLLVETDAPFLAPVPHRGKPNEPAFVLHTAEKIAQIRNEPLAEIAGQTTRNARAVFGI